MLGWESDRNSSWIRQYSELVGAALRSGFASNSSEDEFERLLEPNIFDIQVLRKGVHLLGKRSCPIVKIEVSMEKSEALNVSPTSFLTDVTLSYKICFTKEALVSLVKEKRQTFRLLFRVP